MHERFTRNQAYPLPGGFEGRIMPLYVGSVPVARRKGGVCSVAHFRDPDSMSLKISDSRELHYPYARCFVLLPHPDHAENFAVASVHTLINTVNQTVPFAVGFITAYEGRKHAIVDSVQANYSRALLGHGKAIKEPGEILPRRVDEYYSHWRRILTKAAIQHYRRQGKAVIYPDAQQYSSLARDSGEKVPFDRAEKIVADLDQVAGELGLTPRYLTDAEVSRYKLQDTPGRFKIIA